MSEEDMGLSAEGPEKAPESGSAHLRLCALQSQHWSLRVLLGRGPHRAPNSQPVPDHIHFPKGYLWGNEIDTRGFKLEMIRLL